MVFRRGGHGRLWETLRGLRGASTPGVALVASEVPSWPFLVYVFLGGGCAPSRFRPAGGAFAVSGADTLDTPLRGYLDRIW